MDLLKSIIQRGYGLLAVAAVCIFSLSFSAISIHSANVQDQGLQTLIKHPFKVSAAIFTVRKAVAEMHIRMGRLMSYNAESDVILVRQKVTDLSQAIEKDVTYILNFYLGPKEEAQFIADSLHDLYAEQKLILDRAPTYSKTELAQHIENTLGPIYRSIDDTFTDKMLTYIDNTRKRLSAQSKETLRQNIFFSVFISILMIAIAIVAQQFAYTRAREKESRDYILKIISENAGNIFMLYSLAEKSMEYVSPNISTLIGVDKALIEKQPECLIDYCDPHNTGSVKLLFDSDIIRTHISDECLFKNPKTGEERWMLMHIYPVQEKNVISRYIIAISDLTEIKKTQQVLRDALLNAQNANKAKSQFFSRMSHDIRTPMNAIIGMTTIAAAALDDKARLTDCLSKIGSSSRHLLMLINDVLDMSKIESGKFSIARTPFNFADLIKNVTSIIYPQTQAKHQHFELTNNVTHEILVGDPLRLNQILLNILSNAMKFTHDYGNIRMQITERPDKHNKRVWMYFTISDTGVGMTPEFLERIFLPFEQEHAETTSISVGTGLGMAIAKNIVSLMHGTISVDSTPGEGTVFKVGVSFDVNPDKALHQAIELDALKVLVVDDDQDTCEHTSIILTRIGVQAEWVLSGNEAVLRVVAAHERNEGYDVVFMDWKMPEIDGLEATRRIRKHVGPDTLIIIISAYDWSEIEQDARRAGANAFISKPMFQSTIYNTLLAVTKGLPVEQQHDNTPPDFTGKRFLLVEDNEINSEIAVEFLKITGADIDTVENGEEAVTTFQNSTPGTYAAVLMDIQMPIMNGYQATRAIRHLPHVEAMTIPIIAMTANAFADDVAAALQSGMNDHIGKPIDIELLFQKLRLWIEE